VQFFLAFILVLKILRIIYNI